MRAIESVCIFSKPNIHGARQIVSALLAWLEKAGVRAKVDEQTARHGNGSSAEKREVRTRIETFVQLKLRFANTRIIDSPILGAEGNQEFLLHARH